ncbi:MAG TPA: hypothetical protein VI199_09185, partial [Novosphingobium sp.]
MARHRRAGDCFPHEQGLGCQLEPGALIDPAATIDTSGGAVTIGAGTRVCAGATLRGPIRIGPGCLIGNGAFL